MIRRPAAYRTVDRLGASAARVAGDQPGRPPAVFDPIRKAEWRACIRREYQRRREERQADDPRFIAEQARLKAGIAARKVVAVGEPGLPEVTYATTRVAAEANRTTPGAIRNAVGTGLRSGGRLWTRPGVPVVQPPPKKRPGRKRKTDVPWVDPDDAKQPTPDPAYTGTTPRPD